jgi:hypothetical protein
MDPQVTRLKQRIAELFGEKVLLEEQIKALETTNAHLVKKLARRKSHFEKKLDRKRLLYPE